MIRRNDNGGLPGRGMGVLTRQYRTFMGIREYWREFSRQNGADWVHLLNGDECTYAVAALGSPVAGPRVSMVLFQDYLSSDLSAGDVRARVKARLKKHALAGLLNRREVGCVLTTNPFLAKQAALHKADKYRKLSYIHEIEATWRRNKTQKEARQEFSLPATAHVLVCYGSLEPRRKNIGYLLDLLERDADGELVGLLVGTVSPTCQCLLDESRAKVLMDRGKLLVRPGFASSRLEELAFSAADAVWLAYKNFTGPSGVLELACAAEVPVIACMGGVIGEIVSTEELGGVIGGEDLEADYRTIIRLLTDDVSYQRAVAACRCRGLQGEIGTFGNAICDAIAKAEYGAKRATKS